MYILIPMAGAGQRFTQEGYRVHKPAIPVLDAGTGVYLSIGKRYYQYRGSIADCRL